MEKKLEVKNLQVSFRTQGGNVKAVRDISFDLYKGETLAIVGESGSGKSVTSKAIIGILAGNSIVEGGEILYDGQDLLKISEDDFHKIRGDKISMIFQDPMSSLNPIMRVGQQLTEAMILKGKASQKNAKKLFNSKLSILKKNVCATYSKEDKISKKSFSKKCRVFDSFCIQGTRLEQQYNEAQASAIALQLTINDLLFLVSKNQKVNYFKKIRMIKNSLKKTVNSYVVSKEDYLLMLNELGNLFITDKKRYDKDLFVKNLTFIKNIIDSSIDKKKPNYFTLGYYVLNNPDFDYTSLPIDELDVMTRKYIDDEFMLDFIQIGEKGLVYSHNRSIELKKSILDETEKALEYFRQDSIDKKRSYQIINKISSSVKRAIDYLEVTKNSTEYTFRSAITNEVDRYFLGMKTNPINQRKYERQLKKFNQLVQKGKNPTWKVVPPVLVDLELEKKNIRHVLHSLRQSIRDDISKHESYNSKEKMIGFIDFMKEEASKVVYKVTKKMAKARAIKLLEEVGIPEPEIRYRQYPFEFSGGMRQRIVIAIALSANPDILICDEPTTALDVTIQSQILESINKIKKERNLSVIFITHDLGVVANMADRIAVMYAGKIVELGTADDIFYDPRHPYTWALLSSMPDLNTKEKLEAIPGTPPNMIYPPKGDAFAERNKYALEIDFEEQPPLFEISETHYAATWLLHPNAPKVNPPKIITERIARMKEAQLHE